MRKLYTKLLPALFLLLPVLLRAQTISWDFGTSTSLTASPISVPSGISVPPLVSGNSFGTSTLLSTATASSGYVGATAGGNAGVAANKGVFSATASAYFEFTITPSASQSVSISEVDFGTRATSTGPVSYDIRSSLDAFASVAATGTITANSAWALKSNTGITALVGTAGQAITIRIYGYGSTGNAQSGTVNWKIDDLAAVTTITGSGVLPTVTVTGTPTAFTTPQGTASAPQTVTVNGANLTGDIKVNAPRGYEVSSDGGTTYTDSLILTDNAGSVSGASVAFRLKASAGAGTNNGNLIFSTPGNSPQTVALTGTVTTTTAINVVINQIYGGGGNSGASFANDFVELYNNNTFPVSMQGWSIQYTSSAGTTWGSNLTVLTATIPAHSFLLIKEASGGSGPALPKADDSGAINMSASTGKLILSHGTVALNSVANPVDGVDGSVVDKVGYGSGATGFEGAPAPAIASNNTWSAIRKVDGVDNNNNSIDFQTIIPPLPRNSAYTTTAPVVTTFNPPAGRTDVPVNFVPSLVFSKPVSAGTGNITLSANGVPTAIPVTSSDIVITNNTVTIANHPLAGNTTYTVTIDAGAFTDVYGNAFAGLTGNAWSFTTYNNTVSVTPDYTNDFTTCSGSNLLPGGFTQYSVIGAQVWDCTSFALDSTASPRGAVQVNGFSNGVNNVNEDWLISPRFDLSDPSGVKFPLLSFWSKSEFSGSNLQLKVSTDYSGTGDPNLAHWTDLNGHFPSSGSATWTQSANINLSDYKQDGVYIAFVYTSTTDDGSRWTLDALKLAFSNTPPPPTLTVSASNVQFGYTAANTTLDKKITVLGNDLTGDITVSSEGSFLVSVDSIHFSTTATIGHDTANNKTEPLFIRFAPGITNTQYLDSLYISILPTAQDTIHLNGSTISPASTLSLVDWNLNWFGTPEAGFGPTDKALQIANVRTILPSLKADLYVLEEVVNESALADIVANNMPGYAYVINNYGSHANPFDPTNFALNTVQKLAFVYNTAKIKNIHTDSLLNNFPVNTAADVNTQYYNDWAGGRYPYMLTADVTLDDNNGGSNTKTIHFINIHAKANTGDVIAAYKSRQEGAFALDSLLRTTYNTPADNVIILGDFNDDLNQTITTGDTTTNTSYRVFTIDHPTDYIFPTKILSQEGQHSDVNFSTSIIDNTIVNKNMSSWFLPNSATVLSDVADQVAGYGTTTTDHYPVFSQFSFTPPTPLPVTLLSFTGVKQDGTSLLSWATAQEQNSASFEIQRSGDNTNFTAIGTVAAKGNSTTRSDYNFTDAHPLTGNNYYRLKQVDLDGKSTYSKTVLLNYSQLNLHISPNPAHGTANIFVDNSNEAFSIRILDLNGAMVKQIQTVPGTSNIAVDISGLARGIYTVKVVSASATITQKLLVQ